MRLRKRRGLNRRALNRFLYHALPESVHIYSYQFGTDTRRWTACTATHNATGAIVGWVSPVTYATQYEALCAAYQRARPVTFYQPALINFPDYVRFSLS